MSDDPHVKSPLPSQQPAQSSRLLHELDAALEASLNVAPAVEELQRLIRVLKSAVIERDALKQPASLLRPASRASAADAPLPQLVVTRGDGIPLPDQKAALEEFKRQCSQPAQPAQPGSGEVKRYLYRHDGLEPDMGHLSDFFHGHAPVGCYVPASDYDRLQSALSAAKAYSDDLETRYHTAHERLTAAQQRIAALHASLRTYGWHKPECDYMQEELPRTCGFMDAIKEPT